MKRLTRTAEFRFALWSRWFRRPLVYLELKFNVDVKQLDWRDRYYWEESDPEWRAARLQDLTQVSTSASKAKTRDVEVKLGFRAQRVLAGWLLVLQVLEGDQWRDATVRDLDLLPR